MRQRQRGAQCPRHARECRRRSAWTATRRFRPLAVAPGVLLAITALVPARPTRAGAIPPYPDATRFCGGHVSGAAGGGATGPHVEWTASHAPSMRQTRWWPGSERRLASGLHRREGRQDVWRVPSNQPTEVLNVSAPGDTGPSCRLRRTTHPRPPEPSSSCPPWRGRRHGPRDRPSPRRTSSRACQTPGVATPASSTPC